MGGKAKPTKHTRKEIDRKHAAAKARAGGAGGGKSGKSTRINKTKKVKLVCRRPGCFVSIPDIKTMSIHYDSKHAKVNWAEEKPYYEDMINKAKAEIGQEKYSAGKNHSGGKKKK